MAQQNNNEHPSSSTDSSAKVESRYITSPPPTTRLKTSPSMTSRKKCTSERCPRISDACFKRELRPCHSRRQEKSLIHTSTPKGALATYINQRAMQTQSQPLSRASAPTTTTSTPSDAVFRSAIASAQRLCKYHVQFGDGARTFERGSDKFNNVPSIGKRECRGWPKRRFLSPKGRNRRKQIASRWRGRALLSIIRPTKPQLRLGPNGTQLCYVRRTEQTSNATEKHAKL